MFTCADVISVRNVVVKNRNKIQSWKARLLPACIISYSNRIFAFLASLCAAKKFMNSIVGGLTVVCRTKPRPFLPLFARQLLATRTICVSPATCSFADSNNELPGKAKSRKSLVDLWGSAHRNVKLNYFINTADPRTEEILAPLRSEVKKQVCLVLLWHWVSVESSINGNLLVLLTGGFGAPTEAGWSTRNRCQVCRQRIQSTEKTSRRQRIGTCAGRKCYRDVAPTIIQ